MSDFRVRIAEAIEQINKDPAVHHALAQLDDEVLELRTNRGDFYRIFITNHGPGSSKEPTILLAEDEQATVTQIVHHLRFIAGHLVRYKMTPSLNAVSRDLTAAALAQRLDPLIGREKEIERCMELLGRRSKNNPVLIGDAGVGKTAIVEGLAQRIVAGLVPEVLCDKRVVALDSGLLNAGTKYRGDFETRLKMILRELVETKNCIVFADELHTLMDTSGAEGSLDAANLLKPVLARGEIQVIGATTLEQYRKSVESDPAFERRFQPIIVPETTTEQTIEILKGLRGRYESHHRVRISDAALVAAAELSHRYIQDRYLPDKAVDLIDEASARLNVSYSSPSSEVRQLRLSLRRVQQAKDVAIGVRDYTTASHLRTQELALYRQLLEVEISEKRENRLEIGPREIADIVVMWTGIPAARASLEEAERLLHLEEELHRRVIGQDEAVAAVAQAVRRSRTDLSDRRRPIGSFLFVGPTGVGKTELARALAAALFGSENAMLKLDMSEFMERHTVARLVGSPPGYVGYDSPGQLTETVRRRPYNVVLFDEIEKAHPQVSDLLLQVLDEGHLTDAKGRLVNFKNTVIILTSNLGTASAMSRRPSGFRAAQSDEWNERYEHAHMITKVLEAVQGFFRPEFLNRFDEVVMFHALTRKQVREVLDIMLAQTQARLSEQGIHLDVAEAVKDLLATRGYQREYGARPLRRVVQAMLEDPLADAILQGQFCAGDHIRVDCNAERQLQIHQLALP